MGKPPRMVSAGRGGARVVVVVPGLSWAAVRVGDGCGDQGDVDGVEAAQDAGEVDGDVVVAEAGGDAQDGSFGGGTAELGAVQGGDGLFPVDAGIGMLVVAGAGMDAGGDEVGPGQPGVVGADQFGCGGGAGQAGGVGDQRVCQGAGGHWSFTSVMAARTAVVSAMGLGGGWGGGGGEPVDRAGVAAAGLVDQVGGVVGEKLVGAAGELGVMLQVGPGFAG